MFLIVGMTLSVYNRDRTVFKIVYMCYLESINCNNDALPLANYVDFLNTVTTINVFIAVHCGFWYVSSGKIVIMYL